jgi:methyl-accepting chemotaxis protein
VANELRDLAARMAATGEAVDKLAGGLAEGIGGASRGAQSHDTTADELALELRIRAREALHAMLGAVGTTLSSTRAIREVSDALRTQLESSFVEFQFGDRVSQMLSIVGNDMTNFAAWVARHPHATQTDAAEWLQALEQSYTMEEQRAHHHGNAHVDRGSEVEFF